MFQLTEWKEHGVYCHVKHTEEPPGYGKHTQGYNLPQKKKNVFQNKSNIKSLSQQNWCVSTI